ncbi:hypothetical protein N7454_007098 [Penicillium verhagenii]|nr:hypothetical protein N7454_007098 [Penicillium verhagenii]
MNSTYEPLGPVMDPDELLYGPTKQLTRGPTFEKAIVGVYFLKKIFTTEIALRELIQRRAALPNIIKAAADASKTKELREELNGINKQIEDKQETLRNEEADLPNWSNVRLRDRYDFVKDFLMYEFDSEPVDDCKARSGCCSRGCGCCEKRHSKSPRGSEGTGHCTSECECCANTKGVEVKSEYPDNMVHILLRLFKKLGV